MAGKGFTVKKDWDNPREHAMPEGVRVPAEMRIGPVVEIGRASCRERVCMLV